MKYMPVEVFLEAAYQSNNGSHLECENDHLQLFRGTPFLSVTADDRGNNL